MHNIFWEGGLNWRLFFFVFTVTNLFRYSQFKLITKMQIQFCYCCISQDCSLCTIYDFLIFKIPVQIIVLKTVKFVA